MESSSAASASSPLLDAVRLFEQLEIAYALVGGVAAMYYGRARFTEDVDFVIQTNHRDTLAANPDVMQQHHFDPGCTWKLYHESGTDVDIWKDEFADQIVQRAAIAPLGGTDVRIAEVHDLVAMKLRAGRLQDDYDVSEIARRQRLDLAALRERTTPEQFRHFEEIMKRG